MSALCKCATAGHVIILLIAAFFSKVHMSHIFPDKMAFSTAILILFVFLLPILCLQCFDAVGWVAGRASGL